jgi:hypothetical protein
MIKKEINSGRLLISKVSHSLHPGRGMRSKPRMKRSGILGLRMKILGEFRK